jgi:hypothetical protein
MGEILFGLRHRYNNPISETELAETTLSFGRHTWLSRTSLSLCRKKLSILVGGRRSPNDFIADLEDEGAISLSKLQKLILSEG